MNRLLDDSEYQSVVLAALLHDIGKFAQRAREPAVGYEDFTEDDYGAHGAHAKWSASFAERFLPSGFAGAGSPMLYHHKPKDHLARIVAQADRLSASERVQAVGGDPAKSRLLPVLGRMQLKGDTSRQGWSEYGFWLKPLTAKREDVFPLAPAYMSDLTPEYASLWEQFAREVVALKEKQLPFRPFLTTLYHLLHKYTWCIPSAAHKSEPDISLFDHLKSTAAIAAALFRSGSSRRFRLIGGDLSGIQSFIYHLSSPDEAQSGMAQRLRGRSFYVSLLTETAARFLLDQMDLPEMNLLWCGGGNFAILAHADADITGPSTRIERWLLGKFQGDIGLATAQVDLDDSGLLNFGDSLSRLGHELQKAKSHKFISTGWHQPFDLQGDVCRICGQDSPTLVCAECDRHERLGKEIPYSSYLYRIVPQTPATGSAPVVEFSEFNSSWGLARELRDVPSEATEVFALNKTDMPIAESAGSAGLGFKFLAQAVPGDGRVIMTFDDMEKKSLGAKYLGALRMDMDNLGRLFSFGFGENRTLSRIAALSRSIDLFFSGYLNTLASEFQTAYILYSGGDDAFIVASWNESVAIAQKIRDELDAYSGNNPHVTISTGIHLFKHAFPIGIAAEISKHKLDGLAKNNEVADKKKDSLAVFEFPRFWDDARAALDFAEYLQQNIKNGKLSRRFVYNLLDIYRTHFRDGRESIGWVPHFRYHLKRNVPAEDEAGNANELFAQMLAKMPTMMKIAPIWANWVLLATRE